MFEERLVEGCDVLAGGTVYEYRIEDVHLHDGIAQFLFRQRCIRQLFLIVGEVDTVTVEDVFLRRGDTHHVEFQSVALHQYLVLRANLFDEHATHRSDTADEEVEHLIF